LEVTLMNDVMRGVWVYCPKIRGYCYCMKGCPHFKGITEYPLSDSFCDFEEVDEK